MSDLPVVGVVRETAAGEERVALDPEVTAKLVASGFDVLVEPGAGRASWFRDQDYASSGAAGRPRRAARARPGGALPPAGAERRAPSRAGPGRNVAAPRRSGGGRGVRRGRRRHREPGRAPSHAERRPAWW